MVVIFTIIKLTYATILLLYQHDSITTQFDEALTASVDELIYEYRDRVPVVTDAELAPARDLVVGPIAGSDVAVRIYDPEAGLVAASDRSAPGARPEVVRRALATRSVVHASVEHEEAGSRRLAARRFQSRDGETFVMVVAADDRYASRMLALVSRVILVMTPLGVAAAAVTGWFIAGIAVRPIEEARRVAAGWSPESMGAEVDMHAHDSEVSRLENELEDARRRIEAGFEAQARFMSNVSHELRTPISTILTEAQVLDADDAPPDVRAFIHSTEVEMSKLGRLVESFLMLTRVRHGKAETIVRSCPVNDLLMDSVEDCARLAAEHDVRLDPTLLDADDDLGARIAGDPDLLRTMLDNLVRNAIRFSPRGGLVDVHADADDEQIRIRVRDRGPGIPEEIIDTIFDRFAQARQEYRRGRGHGLGLEIAKGIAELHAGDIAVRNLEDGCVFTVVLPRRREPAPS